MIRVLKNLYSDDFFHDIVPCDKGVYIILKETSNLESTKNDIRNLYLDIVKGVKIDKAPSKIPIDRKKEK